MSQSNRGTLFRHTFGCAFLLRWNMDKYIDVTEILLTSGFHGKDCLGNGEHIKYECCCDECDHYLECFPEYYDYVYSNAPFPVADE